MCFAIIARCCKDARDNLIALLLQAFLGSHHHVNVSSMGRVERTMVYEEGSLATDFLPDVRLLASVLALVSFEIAFRGTAVVAALEVADVDLLAHVLVRAQA